MKGPAKLVQPIHFEDYAGKDFERLVLAFHIRVYRWHSLEWYGQVGSDMGRDIWGVLLADASKSETICIQCANRKSFTSKKAIRDINKVLVSSSGKPKVFKLVCASSVSAKARDKIKEYAESNGIRECVIWSGAEFEEHLRSHCESLLLRFVNGVSFPESVEELKKFTQDLQVPCNVPHPPISQFIQPGAVWKALESSMTALPRPYATRHIIVLHGLHGIGKTQAACTFAWESRPNCSAILWLQCDSREILKSSFSRLCNLEALDLPEQHEQELEKRILAARRWLKEHTDWMLVADNIDNEDVRDLLLELVAPSFCGVVLATSCLNNWPPICNRIRFDVWHEYLCVDFLVRRLGLSQGDKAIAAKIGHLLGGLPLALEQAAAYIEQTHIPMEIYLQKLEATVNQEIQRHTPGTTNYPLSLTAILKQSFSRLSPEAVFLLNLTSFLAPTAQFLKIFDTIIFQSSTNRAKKLGIRCPAIHPETNILELNRWSLVRQRGSEFDVHPLVQTVIRENLSQSERKLSLDILSLLFFSPFGNIAAPYNSNTWSAWWQVFPHMYVFVQHIRDRGDRQALGYLLNLIGLFLNSQGLYNEAIKALTESVEATKEFAGPNSADTAATLNNLGEVLTNAQRPSEAKPRLLDAIAIVQKTTPLIKHAQSSCWNNLGLCHKALGELDAAEIAFRKAIELDKARDASEDDFCLVHQSNLALLLSDDPNKTEEVEKIYRNVAAKMRDEVKLAGALANLGAFLYCTERAPEAIMVLEKALKIQRHYFPPDHREIKTTALHLAVARKKASLT